MADLKGDVRCLLGALISDNISRRQTFYVAEIAGEDPKYGMERDFVTDKKSPYQVSPALFFAGRVYEIKDDRSDMRVWFQVDAVDESSTLPVDLTVIDNGDNPDEDAILSVVDEETDADAVDAAEDGDSGRWGRLGELLDEADEETLDRVEALLDTEDGDTETATKRARVDLSNVPAGVRKSAKTQRSAFDAAFQKHTDAEPGPFLKAIVSDAAVLAARSGD